MNQKIKNLILITIIIVLIVGGWFFINNSSKNTEQVVEEWEFYTNADFNISFTYPPSWEVDTKAWNSMIFIPSEEKPWNPKIPTEINEDPRIQIYFGESIRERLGPKYFPETISSAILEEWLEKGKKLEERGDIVKKTINGFESFESIETYTSGCYKVVYWRPINLDSLVRIQIGCESKYLDDFNQIVNTLEQID